MQNQTTLITCLPFEGFYCTWSQERIYEMAGCSDGHYYCWDEDNPQGEAETDADYCDRREAHFEAIRQITDWAQLKDKFAREYVKQFAAYHEIKLDYESLVSPREYNFTTDRIYAYIELDEAKRLYDQVHKELLDRIIAERFTSRPGFASFYEPDRDVWGLIEEWDHNQLAALIEAFTQNDTQDACDLMDDFYI